MNTPGVSYAKSDTGYSKPRRHKNQRNPMSPCSKVDASFAVSDYRVPVVCLELFLVCPIARRRSDTVYAIVKIAFFRLT